MATRVHTVSAFAFNRLLTMEIGSSRSDNFGPPWRSFAAGDRVVLHERASEGDLSVLTGRSIEFDVVEVTPDPTCGSGQLAIIRRVM